MFADRFAHPRPRAVIFASNNLDMWIEPDYTSKDMATAMWLVKDAPFSKVYVTATYHPDDSNLPKAQRALL